MPLSLRQYKQILNFTHFKFFSSAHRVNLSLVQGYIGADLRLVDAKTYRCHSKVSRCLRSVRSGARSVRTGARSVRAGARSAVCAIVKG